MKEGDLEKLNLILQEKYKQIQLKEERCEELFVDDAALVVVAYGTMARIAKSVIRGLRGKGKKIGLIRPITLWPFPTKIFRRMTTEGSPERKRGAQDKIHKALLVIEMSYGQMLEDVRLAVDGKISVDFLGRAGGGIPTEEEIKKKVNRLMFKH